MRINPIGENGMQKTDLKNYNACGIGTIAKEVNIIVSDD